MLPGHRPSGFVFPLLWCVVTVISAFVFHARVELKPQVDKDFFFSSDDPQFQADKTISETFPQPEQFIFSVQGDLRSQEYVRRIGVLTEEARSLPEAADVQSLTRGPKNPTDAFESPLWRRALISDDEKSSIVLVLVKLEGVETVLPKLEALREKHSAAGFEIILSGAPYIVEMIRQSLLRDFLVFSAIAFFVFAAAIFVLFRSLPILVGALLSCLNAGLLTLIFAAMLKIKIGPMTSNLSVIVFVLTLTHIIFITFNWKHALSLGHKEAASEGVWMTFTPSFWSMITQLLGFVSLLFVQATPLRQLGTAGIIGAVTAFAVSYLIYPSFLRLEASGHPEGRRSAVRGPGRSVFFEKTHGRVVFLLVLLAAIAGFGIPRLNVDPDLFTFFQKGGELRTGLEYIDRNGGSTPLNLVVADEKGEILNTGEAYKRLWSLHQALERDPAVGSVISLPAVLAEAKRAPMASFLPTGWLVKLLEQPYFGSVARYFLTEDNRRALFFLRMNEMNRDAKRLDVVKRMEGIVRKEGFLPVQVGGVYVLQGKMSQLVVSSTLEGLFILIVIFVLIGGILLRSFRVMAAIFASLLVIPIWTIGTLGHFRVPFDIISCPGVNIAIGIGVDALINMIFFVRRQSAGKRVTRESWAAACARLWRPIFYSTVVVCMGFGIFAFSAFPPTQRFGLSVILASVMTPLAALFVFPWLAGRMEGKVSPS